jgi:tubulin polyglutamylase TTLL1
MAGFARFCTAEYSSDVQDMDNAYMHLTNVAIQKHGALFVRAQATPWLPVVKFLTHRCVDLGPGEDYNANHGGKWSMRNLMLYIESTMGSAEADQLAASIDTVIIHSLRACQNVIINDKHCFELYDAIFVHILNISHSGLHTRLCELYVLELVPAVVLPLG